MIYIPHQIIPLGTSGRIKIDNKNLEFNFINSAPASNIGNLYLYGIGSNGINESIFIVKMEKYDFKEVYEKMCHRYRIQMKDITVNTYQYQLLIVGTKHPENNIAFNNSRFITVFFTNSFKKVILADSKEMDIAENNIDDFLKSLDNYDLG
ncbi:hypothetical protein [Cytophaga hutchinsonii]|uniref:Uncharacterized protein n=1 Tax=Cytophaga hutchinsonii (strain ATCC 33406 / DSM 1761 / CIP 103989 / NBRC 15051 / NCIMB 9469 / D465) TaxID=269798 RepID=A0A6N4SQ94_CYTH3|nr:hypothetical protein [Cytophaga hutchinsonii]ABG58446.1 hypothetical protein CHU_1171 [Cytophaga hutchinsonii ATCC 33406]SFX74609.1 hypothetical protein SAMN04487930_10912 [Cytophaga hutchinsonii ATCC 33406]